MPSVPWWSHRRDSGCQAPVECCLGPRLQGLTAQVAAHVSDPVAGTVHKARRSPRSGRRRRLLVQHLLAPPAHQAHPQRTDPHDAVEQDEHDAEGEGSAQRVGRGI